MGCHGLFHVEKGEIKGAKNSIYPHILPKTIKDIILITRDLKIQCIWVDSLCIDQDSGDDLARECEAMGSICAGSYCKTAATAASSNEGCIFDRDPASVRSIRIQLHLEPLAWQIIDTCQIPDDRASTSQSAFQTEEYAVTPDEDVCSLDIENGPLLQRAWVVQERLLAPRNLHCSKRQIGIEIEEWLACETYPTGFPENILSFKQLKQHFSVRIPFVKRDELGRREIDVMRLAWALFVKEFSKGKLSGAHDKLLAVLGVAIQTGEAISSHYVRLYE